MFPKQSKTCQQSQKKTKQDVLATMDKINTEEIFDSILESLTIAVAFKSAVEEEVKRKMGILMRKVRNPEIQKALLSCLKTDDPGEMIEEIIKALDLYRKESGLKHSELIPVTMSTSDPGQDSDNEAGLHSKLSPGESLPSKLPWVVDKDKITYDDQDIGHMSDALAKVSKEWASVPDIDYCLINETTKIVTFTLGGNTYCFLRHLLLYLQILKETPVEWRFNLDRGKDRRMTPLLKSKDEEGERLLEPFQIYSNLK